MFFFIRGKVKVKFTLGQAVNNQRYSSTLYLTLALDGVGGQGHVPAALSQGKRLGTHSTGPRVVPRVGIDGCGKSCPQPDSISGPFQPS
jgi:hypothetical protein